MFLIGASLYARYLIQSVQKQNEHTAWKFERSWEMRSERTSWLNLAGLFWLGQGNSTMGLNQQNDFYIRDREGPDYLGTFIRNQESVYFEPSADIVVLVDDKKVGERIKMINDAEGEVHATKLRFQNLTWWVIARDGRLGVRVWDDESAERTAFKGIPYFQYDLDWRVDARFVPYQEPQEFTYPTVIGTMRTETSPGLLVFQYADKQYEMIPFERDEGTRLFLVFGDLTNGDETYGGGRFVYVDKPDDTGHTVIDFNKAYNPPCAFSSYSTCPQPLAQNKLPFSVDAGEKKYIQEPVGESTSLSAVAGTPDKAYPDQTEWVLY